MSNDPTCPTDFVTDLIGKTVDVEPRLGWHYNGRESPRIRGIVRAVGRADTFVIVVEETGAFGEPRRRADDYGVLHELSLISAKARVVSDPGISQEDAAQSARATMEFLARLLDVIGKYIPRTTTRSIEAIETALASREADVRFALMTAADRLDGWAKFAGQGEQDRDWKFAQGLRELAGKP